MRTVIVSGSASGIGRATAELLVRNGSRVIGVDRMEAEVQADLGTSEGRNAALSAVTGRCPDGIDAVIACAGICDAPAEEVVSVNYFGVVALLDGLLPLFRPTAPRAVVVVSTATILPMDPGTIAACLDGDEAGARAAAAASDPVLPYSSSKHALHRWIRREASTAPWAGAGILLNGVAPGIVHTPMTAPRLANPLTRPALERSTPSALRRYAQPEELAHALAFLASPENSYMVGQTIFIDGGADVLCRGDDIVAPIDFVFD